MEDPQLHPQSFPASYSRHTRLMGKLRDSLFSELAASNPSISVNSDYGSHIQRRLQELFSSLKTPSHPPYALMIQRAIIDLNDATGSTKEAISEFIKREYKDLPWAHMAILGHHLRKLCDAGELLCTESGSYTVYNGNLGAGGETNRALEWNEDVEREKELQGQENEKQTQVSVLQIIETNEPSRMQEAQGGWIQEEVEAHEHSIERSEDQNKSGKGFLGTIEQKSLPQRQEIRVIAESEAENFQNIKIQQIQKLDEDTTFGDPEQQLPKRQGQGGPPKLKSGPDKSTSQKQKQKQLQPRGQVRGVGRPPKLHGWQKQQQQLQPSIRGQGQCRRHKLHRDSHRCEEQLQSEDQGQVPVNSLNLDVHQCEEQLQPEDQGQGPENSLNLDAHRCEEQLQPEDQDQGSANFLNSRPGVYSSQPMESNLPATLALISKQQFVVPISEGPPECIPVIVNELLQTRLCGPLGTDLGVKSRVSASPSLLNVNNHDQPQHWHQGSHKRNLLENLALKDLEQQPQKRRRRGRPPKAKPDAGYPGESLPLDDGILNEQNPNVISTSQKQPPSQNQSRVRGRGRPRKVKPDAGYPEELLPLDDDILNEQNPNVTSTSQKQQPSQNQSRVRGRGRPRKVRTDAQQCMEQVQPQDQARGLLSAPNSEPNEIQGQEQKQLQLESQAQNWQKPPNLESGVDESYTLLPQGSSLEEGWLSKENTPADQSQMQQLYEFSGALGRGQSQGRGRGRRRGRGRGRGVLGRPPKPMFDANESKHMPQSQPCLGQVRRRGRPPKQKPLSQDSQPVLDACQSFQELQSQPMSDVCQSNQQLQSQPCQVQDQILMSLAEPQPEVDISSTSSMLVYKRKKKLIFPDI